MPPSSSFSFDIKPSASPFLLPSKLSRLSPFFHPPHSSKLYCHNPLAARLLVPCITMDLNNILNNSTDELFARKGSFKSCCYPQIQVSSKSSAQTSLNQVKNPRTLHSTYSQFQPSYASSPPSTILNKKTLDRKTHTLHSTSRKKCQHLSSNFRIAKSVPSANRRTSTDSHSLPAEKHMQRQAISNSPCGLKNSITAMEAGKVGIHDVGVNNRTSESEKECSTQINEGQSARKRASFSEPWYDDDESTDGLEDDKCQKVKKPGNKSKRSKAPNSAWSQEEDMKLVRYWCSCSSVVLTHGF